MNVQRRSSTVVTNNQNAHSAVYDTEQKMVWKSFEIHAPKAVLADVVGFRRVGGFLKEESQLAVEVICEVWSGGLLVVINDLRVSEATCR